MTLDTTMRPRSFRVESSRDQVFVGADRYLDLERIARELGRSNIWTAEHNAIEADNQETDRHLAEGNHPIQDEYLADAKLGMNIYRLSTMGRLL